MENRPRIAIVGAGPGGLTLARVLHRHGIHAAVFEGEAFAAARRQGGSLDMHAESGQFAIERAGLTPAFVRIARYDDQETRVYDKHGTLRFADTDTAGKDRPEVDRGQLRQVLLDSLPADRIRWDHKLRAVVPQDDGTFAVSFANGVRQTFDLVVGADGAWSRVRPMVSDIKPVYSGVLFLELGIADADTRYPEIAQIVGRGLMFALGDRKALIGHRDAGAHVGIYAALRVPETWAASGALDTSSPTALKTSLAAHFSDWSGDLRQLILSADEDAPLTPRPISALPVGCRWEHRRGVTLLGDAAHLMSPFSGEGANLAMQDAAELALALAHSLTGGEDWDAAICGYESAMFARAAEAAAGAKEGIEEAFSDDALTHMVAHMRQQAGLE